MPCEKYNKLLKHGVISDALHDFKDGWHETIVAGTDLSICPGIPKMKAKTDTASTFTEDQLLYKLLQHNGLTPRGSFNKQLLTLLVANNYNLVWTTNQGNNNKSYNITMLHKGGETNIKSLKPSRKILQEFFRGDNPHVLIDSGYIEFLQIFSDTGFNIHRVINRETLNDPCPSSKGLASLEGISTKIDIDGDNKVYDKDSLFFTKYKLALSPIEGTTTTFTIHNKAKKLFETSNYRENSIPACIKAFADAQRRGKHDELWPAIYQRKRAGDWLMALSCLDHDRLYRDEDDEEENITASIILKTIDRLLLWYCLFIGVDALYETENTLIYFKRLGDEDDEDDEIGEADDDANDEADDEADEDDKEDDEVNSNAKAIALERGLEHSLARLAAADNVKATARAAANAKAIARTAAHAEYMKQSDAIHRSLMWAAKTKDKAVTAVEHHVANIISRHIEKKAEAFLAKSKPFISQNGGGAQELCKKYVKELAADLEGFESNENSDYQYYEHLACIIIACVKEFGSSAQVYNTMQTILFDILPSIEGHIKTDRADVIQFFKKDRYTADCVSFAARNVASHALGSSSKKTKHSIVIPKAAVDTYTLIQSSLPKSFIERRTLLVNEILKYAVDKKTIQASVVSNKPLLSKMLLVSGGANTRKILSRKRVTRKK